MVWQHFYNGDSYEYIYLAENLKQGSYYGANPLLEPDVYRLTVRTPVYPLYIFMIYNILGYYNWIILLMQNLASVASCFLIYRTFRQLCPAPKYSWIMGLMIACYPAQMIFASMVTPDILLQFFLMLYFRQLLFFLNNPAPRRVGYMSLWLILATLTKPVVYPFLLLHFGWTLILAFRHRKATLSLTGALPLVVMVAYGLWNQQRTGLFHISSIQSINMLDFNIRRFQEVRYGKPHADSVYQREHAAIDTLPGLKEKYEYASQAAARILRADLPAYALFHARESLRFFIDPGKSEIDLFAGSLTYHGLLKKVNFYTSLREGGLRGAWNYLRQFPTFLLVLVVIIFNLLRVAGSILFVFNRKIPLQIRLACSIYVIYFAAVTGPVANTRYFLPVMLVCAAMAAVGWGHFLSRKRKRPLLKSML